MKYLLILTLLAFGCAEQKSGKKIQTSQVGQSRYVKNQLVVKGNLNSVQEQLSSQGISIVKKELIDTDIYLLTISSSQNLELKELSASLLSLQGVDFVEPNYLVSSKELAPPKDSLWITQWALKNYGQDSPRGLQGKENSDIQALKAWEINTGSKEIIVGVVDTGIDYNHPDLKDNIWVNEKELNGIKGQDDDGNGYADDIHGWNAIASGHEEPYYGQIGSPDPMDDNGHGSHCAGIIGATGGNFQGVSGINWKVSLMALKFLDKDGSGNSVDAYRAISYGIKNKVHILSNSWGGGEKSDLVKAAIQKAEKQGILFIAAAGNSGGNNDETPNYPSNYEVESIISVAASDNRDLLAEFSCYGKETVHIAAPGVDIMSTIPTSMANEETGAYESFSGTSMATPYVAGAAALIMANDESLRYNPIAAKDVLLGTVDVSPQLSGVVSSRGRLNVFRALKKDFNPEVSKTEFKTQEKVVSSPRYNRELMDHVWTIEKEGAKRIRINFDYVLLDLGFDLIALYDENNNLIHSFEKNYLLGYTSPWIEGSKIQVRMANALVYIRNQETKEYEDSDQAFTDGANSCSGPDTEGMYQCNFDVDSDPFANYESEGFQLSSFDYQE